MGHHSGSVGTSQKIMYSDEEDEQHQVLILAGSVKPIVMSTDIMLQSTYPPQDDNHKRHPSI